MDSAFQTKINTRLHCFACYQSFPNKKSLTMHLNHSQFCKQSMENNFQCNYLQDNQDQSDTTSNQSMVKPPHYADTKHTINDTKLNNNMEFIALEETTTDDKIEMNYIVDNDDATNENNSS